MPGATKKSDVPVVHGHWVRTLCAVHYTVTFQYVQIILLFQVYNEQVYQLSTGCAKQASESGVKRFVEVSSAQVYSSDKVRYVMKVIMIGLTYNMGVQ